MTDVCNFVSAIRESKILRSETKKKVDAFHSFFNFCQWVSESVSEWVSEWVKKWFLERLSPLKIHTCFCMLIIMFVAALSIQMIILSFIWLDEWISWTKKLTPILHVICDVCGLTSPTKNIFGFIWVNWLKPR